MALKGQAWHDARAIGVRRRAAIAERRAVDTWNHEHEMSQPIEIDREEAEEILSAARTIVDLLSTALEK